MLMCNQISSNSFKNKITNKLFNYKSYMHIHSNVCKQMTGVKLLLLHSNTVNHFTVHKRKKMNPGLFKNVYNSYIYI